MIIKREVEERRQYRLLERFSVKTSPSSEIVKARALLIRLLAHELRNCLDGVVGLTDVMRMSRDAGCTADHAPLAHESACELKNLVEPLLDLALADPERADYRLAAVEARPLLAGVVAFHRRLAARAGVRISSSIDQRVPTTLRCDRHRLALALHLAVWDAVRGATPGDQVTVGLEVLDDGAWFRIDCPTPSLQPPGAASAVPAWNPTELQPLVVPMGARLAIARVGARLQVSLGLPLAPSKPPAPPAR